MFLNANLLAMADPNDSDGDGISGTVNWITIPGYSIPSSSSGYSKWKAYWTIW